MGYDETIAQIRSEQEEHDFVWATVRRVVEASRVPSVSVLILNDREVRALADLIESEWGFQLSEDEVKRISLYGSCEDCGFPRNVRTTWAAEAGSSVMDLFCPRCER